MFTVLWKQAVYIITVLPTINDRESINIFMYSTRFEMVSERFVGQFVFYFCKWTYIIAINSRFSFLTFFWPAVFRETELLYIRFQETDVFVVL